jgi:hypothetical protein
MMPANTSPIFTLTPHIAWGSSDPAGSGSPNGPLLTANTATDGTGSTLTIFTAGANGSYVQRVIARAVGTNVASVLRIFINNGSASSTQANNVLIGEMTLPATTASAVSALQPIEYPLNFALPASYVINVCLGTTVAAGYRVSCVGGDY